MATIEKKVSDLSGEEGDVQTISFAFGDQQYEVDVTPAELKKMQDTFNVYVANARRKSKFAPVPFSANDKPKSRRRDPEQTRAMKDWLRANGYTVPARGRIGKDLEDAYNTQTPAPAETADTAGEDIIEKPKKK